MRLVRPSFRQPLAQHRLHAANNVVFVVDVKQETETPV